MTHELNSQSVWDASLTRLDGHLLQSWQWGEFKSRHGWEVERVAIARPTIGAAAQILFRRRGPFSLGYIPRGPALEHQSTDAAEELIAAIDEVCKRRRCLNLIIEPDHSLPFSGNYRSRGFVRGPEHFQPSRTVKVPLLDDEALLGQMHQKTRYSVRLAERRGVEIRQMPADEYALKAFYALLRETATRNEFGIHGADYYGDFVRTFGDRALLMFAFVESEPAASLISACFGKEAVYMYGASSTQYRSHGAAFALQFEAMRWARSRGCTTYDLWGIPDSDPPPRQDEGGRVAGTKGDDWRGLYKFKVGFGGRIQTYPPTLERRYHPYLSVAARRLYAHRLG